MGPRPPENRKGGWAELPPRDPIPAESQLFLPPFLHIHPLEPLQFPCWTLQLATLHVSFGGLHVEGHAYLLPGHLEHLKAIEAKQKEPAPKLLPHPEPEPEPEPAPVLESSPAPAPPPVAELEPASPASDPTGLEEGPPLTSAPVPAPELEPTGPWAVTAENQLREEKLNILDFPPRLVAEQLTRMEAELFKKLVPAHCLGSIWSQRDSRDHKYLAPTIRDTVAHTNTLANSVIATCLGALGMTAQDRARMVELWIHVPKLKILVPDSVTPQVPGVSSLGFLGICLIQNRRSP
nr:ral guanine nucleotide dissociation stimulator-like [Equus caballus]